MIEEKDLKKGVDYYILWEKPSHAALIGKFYEKSNGKFVFKVKPALSAESLNFNLTLIVNDLSTVYSLDEGEKWLKAVDS